MASMSASGSGAGGGTFGSGAAPPPTEAAEASQSGKYRVPLFVTAGVRGQYQSNVSDLSIYVGLTHLTERRRAQAEIQTLDLAAKEAAIAAYMQPTASAGLIDALATSTIGEAELKRSLLDARSRNQFDVLDQLERAREDLEVAERAAEEAAGTAAARQEAVAGELDGLRQIENNIVVMKQRREPRINELNRRPINP